MKITGNAGGGKAMTQWSPYRGNMYHTGGGELHGNRTCKDQSSDPIPQNATFSVEV